MMRFWNVTRLLSIQLNQVAAIADGSQYTIVHAGPHLPPSIQCGSAKRILVPEFL